MESIIARENMLKAMQTLERNAGAAGVDGMTTEQLRGYLRGQIRERSQRSLDLRLGMSCLLYSTKNMALSGERW